MSDDRSLKVEAVGEREVRIARSFNAPCGLVFEAWTKPEFVQQWLLGPEGWTMPVCRIDLRVGGSYRYEWRNEARKISMGVGGAYLELVPGERIVSTEKFDDAWYPGEALLTILFDELSGMTNVVQIMRYDSREGRDAVLQSPMESGVAVSFNRLDEVLAEVL